MSLERGCDIFIRVTYCKHSAVSCQPSAVSRQLKAHATRTALWHRLNVCGTGFNAVT
ncbi:MAG: hypothetical protein F6J90_27350 [Moorea sp. SIOASIH]|uniref:hypothetical protein n=1 Tax=Moorena sp. SIOASIH TaxID=2607817 RepID=UPI0013BB9976|nr:hypothetical protein [Moorena sp. SIOASIH]NEO39848.1 hypothetical protein [Moorena sp. SIOASIH]